MSKQTPLDIKQMLHNPLTEDDLIFSRDTWKRVADGHMARNEQLERDIEYWRRRVRDGYKETSEWMVLYVQECAETKRLTTLLEQNGIKCSVRPVTAIIETREPTKE